MKKYIELKEKNGYQYVTRLIGNGAVVVIASKVIQGIRNFQLILSTRPTFDRPILEFPAGLLDVPGESIYDAGLRELYEETGWSINDTKVEYSLLNTLPCPSSAGLSDEILYLIKVRINDDAVRGNSAHTVGESIKILDLMDIPAIYDFIEANNNEIFVSSRVTAFLFGYNYINSRSK